MVTFRIRRSSVAISLTLGLLLALVAGVDGAAGHPKPDKEKAGIGVLVNGPDDLAGFRPAAHWSGSGPIADQTADLVYAGTGCTPASYLQADVEGKIAIVDDRLGATPGDGCPLYLFFQKAQAAERAGAIGLVQVRRDDGDSGRNAIDSEIPVLELTLSAGEPIRNAVVGGDTVNVTLTRLTAVPTERLSDVPCVDGTAGPFDCEGIDLLSFVPHTEFDSAGISDIWGWTDPDGGDEYVMMGKTNGTAFFRVTDPLDPVYLGALPNPALNHQTWHDIKVYNDHAFIVSESEAHGMLVFDLTRLRGVTEAQEWDADARYRLNWAAHNIAINEDSGFAYIVGGNAGIVAPDQCLSGLHMVDIRIPKEPTFAGCYATEGGPGTAARSVGGPVEEHSPAAYVHDAQCVDYDGPDEDYRGREICLMASEDKVVIADVTDKALPKTLGTTDYPNVTYAHQGWFSDDKHYWFVNDELDESEGAVERTRTIVLDVSDLENPKVHLEHFHKTVSPDHNHYVHNGLLYQSNYSAGLRVLDTADVGNPKKKPNKALKQIAFFDTYPDADDTFDGTWSNYPFFDSGTIAVSGRNEGLFLLRLQAQEDDLGSPSQQDGPPLHAEANGLSKHAGTPDAAEKVGEPGRSVDGDRAAAATGVARDARVGLAASEAIVPARSRTRPSTAVALPLVVAALLLYGGTMVTRRRLWRETSSPPR